MSSSAIFDHATGAIMGAFIDDALRNFWRIGRLLAARNEEVAPCWLLKPGEMV